MMIENPSEIHEQWHEPSPSSPCSGCSRRDTNCVSSPFYGVGDFDAQAMYLAHDPGGGSSVDEDSDKWYNRD
ncbi:hypothetical protein, partial [Halorubrum ezzemoulense]|uniref:hypothetical protein n=1 Tax=Halorubrum ezzemoulense TaxID=337243 RepID=UPI00232D3EC4